MRGSATPRGEAITSAPISLSPIRSSRRRPHRFRPAGCRPAPCRRSGRRSTACGDSGRRVRHGRCLALTATTSGRTNARASGRERGAAKGYSHHSSLGARRQPRGESDLVACIVGPRDQRRASRGWPSQGPWAWRSPTISDVARQRYRTITVENARKFARYFGCSIEDHGRPDWCRSVAGDWLGLGDQMSSLRS